MSEPTMQVSLSRGMYRSLLEELARRGNGTKESGAFLLGKVNERPPGPGVWRVSRIVYYDDLDAECLTGGITFRGFDALWASCRSDQSTVIADVHTHPGAWVGQSDIDSSNPMIPRIGHIGVIVPHYAQQNPPVGDLGVYVHRGGHTWTREPSALLVPESRFNLLALIQALIKIKKGPPWKK
jgi:hypothetical protein